MEMEIEKICGVDLKEQFHSGTTKPTPLPVNLDGIPEDLKSRKIWVLWVYEWRQDKQGKGKWTKVPVQPKGATRIYQERHHGRCWYAACSNDPETWSTFDDIINMFAPNRVFFDGVGIMLREGLLGGDLDNGLDADGTIKPWCREILEGVDTYAEYSPSGTGIKFLCRASFGALLDSPEFTGVERTADLRKRKKYADGEVEIYDESSARFFTLTGHRVEGCPDGVGDRQDAFKDLYLKVFAPELEDARKVQQARESVKKDWEAARNPTEVHFDDEMILKLALAAGNGTKFKSLWEGNTAPYGGDHSAADLALCELLAFWCGPDGARIERLFGSSGLVRDKWTDREDYRARTVRRAIDHAVERGEFYDWSRHHLASCQDEALRIITGTSDARPTPLDQPEPSRSPDPMPQILASVMGRDGSSEGGPQSKDPVRDTAGQVAGAPIDTGPDPYLDDLLRAGVRVDSRKMIKGSLNYSTACPCCGLIGIFWRHLEDSRCGYECSAARKSWAEGKALWRAATSPQGSRRRAYTLDELEKISSPGWLVQGHVAQQSLVLIYGASNVGKSFFVIDLGLSIASGTKYLGRHAVAQGPVVYVVGEGTGGIRKRVKAWRKHHELYHEIPFLVVPHPFALTSGEEEVTELLEIIKDKLGEVAPAMIILDTLSRHFGAGDENATRDMKAFTDSCDRLVAQTGATVAVVHHTGKDATRKERGNVTLRSNSDTVIFVDAHRGREGMAVECQKQKDAEYFDGYKLIRQIVALDGDEMSLVYQLDEEEFGKATSTRTTWSNDLDMAAHYAPTGVENARTITQIVEDIQSGMVVCQMKPIGQNKARTLIKALIRNGTLMTAPSTSGNRNHDRYYRVDRVAPMADFFG